MLALVLGVSLVRAEWFGGPTLPPFVAAQAQEETLAVFNRGDALGALKLARQAVQASPMSAPLYYQLGNILLHFEESDAEVDEAFAIQRFLNPAWPVVSFQQGETWAPVDPRRTAALWRDAFERTRRIDLAQDVSPDHALAYYRGLLGAAASPAVQEGLGPIAAQGPGYALAWLNAVSPEVAARGLPRLVEPPGWAQNFPGRDRPRFLWLWDQKGDRGALAQFLSTHPDWQAAAWPVHLRGLIEAGQFEAAVYEVAAHYQIDLQLPVTAAAADDHLAFRQELEAAAKAAGASPPPEYWRLKAALAAHDFAWEAAWAALRSYLQQTRPAEVLP